MINNFIAEFYWWLYRKSGYSKQKYLYKAHEFWLKIK